MVATDMARGLLRPTMAAMDMAVMEATATERGPLMPSLLLLLRLSQKPMLTTVAMDMAAMVVMDMARGLLMLMPTMVAMDMAAMEATDTARGLLMPTMVATDMAAMVATDTASKPQTSPAISPKKCFQRISNHIMN